MQINLNIDKKIFNEAYLPMLNDYDTRYNVFFGGAGSGKSHFVFQKCVIKALKSRRKFLVIRKNYIYIYMNTHLPIYIFLCF